MTSLRLPYDASSPFMAATILAEDGTRIPLWTPVMNRVRGTVQALPFLAELSVKFTLANIPVITAQLTPTYEDGINFLDTEYIEWGNAKLEVQFGYASGTPQGSVLSPVFTGIMLRPDIQLGVDTRITLNAQGVSTFNIPTQAGRRYLRGTRREVISELLRGPDPSNPRRTRIDDEEMLGAPTEVRRGWMESIIEIQQAGLSDWQWILTLIWECRAFFYILGDTIKVFPRDTRSTAPVSKTFVAMDYPDGVAGPGRSTYPILSATSPSMGVYLPGYLRGSVLQNVDPNTRRVTERVIDDSTVRSGRTGRGAANQTASSANPGSSPQRDGLDVMPGQPADQRAQEQVAAARQDFEQRAGIKLEITSIGIPDLLPGDIIAVRGLGVRLDGPNYMVFDITHTFGNGGYSTQITAYANISQAWTRALPPEGPVPARAPTQPANPDRVEVRSASEAARATGA